MQVHICMEARREVGCLFQLLPTVFSQTGFFTDLAQFTDLARLAGQQGPSLPFSCPASVVLGL